LSISKICNIWKSNNDYLPDPLQTLEGFKKSRNIDLPELDPLELRREELKANQVLAACDLEAILFVDSRGNPLTIRDWLLRRLAAIQKEKQRRGGHLRRVK